MAEPRRLPVSVVDICDGGWYTEPGGTDVAGTVGPALAGPQLSSHRRRAGNDGHRGERAVPKRVDRRDRATAIAGLVAFAVAAGLARGAFAAGWFAAAVVGLVAALAAAAALHRVR